jgi:hypothetical protein
MLQELGADDPLRCVPRSSPEGDRIMGRLLAGEGSSQARVPFRDSSGSHCPLHGSQLAYLRPGCVFRRTRL